MAARCVSLVVVMHCCYTKCICFGHGCRRSLRLGLRETHDVELSFVWGQWPRVRVSLVVVVHFWLRKYIGFDQWYRRSLRLGLRETHAVDFVVVWCQWPPVRVSSVVVVYFGAQNALVLITNIVPCCACG